MTEESARAERLKAWADVGATNIPALFVALGSAALGGIAMRLRKRKK